MKLVDPIDNLAPISGEPPETYSQRIGHACQRLDRSISLARDAMRHYHEGRAAEALRALSLATDFAFAAEIEMKGVKFGLSHDALVTFDRGRS